MRCHTRNLWPFTFTITRLVDVPTGAARSGSAIFRGSLSSQRSSEPSRRSTLRPPTGRESRDPVILAAYVWRPRLIDRHNFRIFSSLGSYLGVSSHQLGCTNSAALLLIVHLGNDGDESALGTPPVLPGLATQHAVRGLLVDIRHLQASCGCPKHFLFA